MSDLGGIFHHLKVRTEPCSVYSDIVLTSINTHTLILFGPECVITIVSLVLSLPHCCSPIPVAPVTHFFTIRFKGSPYLDIIHPHRFLFYWSWKLRIVGQRAICGEWGQDWRRNGLREKMLPTWAEQNIFSLKQSLPLSDMPYVCRPVCVCICVFVTFRNLLLGKPQPVIWILNIACVYWILFYLKAGERMNAYPASLTESLLFLRWLKN